MAPSQRVRPSPFDKFTDASASAVSSGFTAAMALGPQPKLQSDGNGSQSEGTDWLRNLQKAAGLTGAEFPVNGFSSGIASGLAGDDEDLSDEDEGDSEDDANADGGKKKGRKSKSKAKGGKATSHEDSSAAQRKAQNRLAQREFRQRKQQYIRALEARVELLSSDHDTQVNRLRYALRGLLAENNQLRSLLGCMTAFVGTELLGGPLQKAGMSRKELESIIMSSSEKTMTERWEKWPGARECEALSQIRLESNLPAEGLPESHRFQNHSAEQSTSTDGPSTKHSEPKTKRKSTADESGSKTGKRRQQKSNESAGNTPSQGIDSSASTIEAQVQSFAPDFNNMYQADASNEITSYNTLYSQLNPDAANNLPVVPVNPALIGQNMFSPSSASGDSNAILASLFGAGSMAGMFGQSPSSFPQFDTTVPLYADNTLDTNGARQKTIPNVEEPEEIRRINTFANRLSNTTATDAAQLSFALNGISQLIHQMATFRRQPSYQLPTLLLPSDIQQTRPHDPLIDSLPFSGLRQRLILLQDSLVMDDVLLSFLQHIRLHSEDATNVQNWELDVGFFLEYRQLLDRDTLNITNQWRSRRDEKSLSFADLSTRPQ